MIRTLDDMSQMVHGFAHPAITVSHEGLVQTANQAFLEVTGSARATGRALMDLLPPEVAERIARERNVLAMRDGSTAWIAKIPIGKAGRTHGALLSAVINAQGVAGFLLQLLPTQDAASPPDQDLVGETFPGRADDGRRDIVPGPADLDQEARTLILQRAAETTNTGQWYYDLLSRRMWASESFFRLLGRTEQTETLSPRWIRDQIHPNDRKSIETRIKRLRAGSLLLLRTECRLRCADESWKWFQVTAQITHLSSGRHSVLCGSIVDISEYKESQLHLATALREAQRAREQAEAARTEAQEYTEMLSVAAENGKTVPWYVIPDLGFEYIERNVFKLLGYEKPFHIRPDMFRSWMHEDDVSQTLKEYQAIILGEIDTIDHDFRVRRQDGAWIWFNARARRVDRSTMGLPTMICGTFGDISERKADEERLSKALREAESARAEAKASEYMLRVASTCGEICAWSLCRETGEAWMTDEGYRQLGFDVGEFRPDDKGWRERFHPEDLGRAISALEELYSGRREVFDSEHRMKHKDGSFHWYRTIARKIDRSGEGQPDFIAGANICIDRLKENEQRLFEAAEHARRSGERLNTLADNAPGALFEYRIDAQGQMSLPYFSANLPGLLNITREAVEADGAAVLSGIHEEDRPEVVDLIQSSRRSLSRFSARLRIPLPEGGTRILMCKSLPFAQGDGSVIWFGNLFDVTEQETYARRAAQAAEAMRVAHDRLQTVASIAPVGLYEFRRKPDGSVDFPFTSERFHELVGLDSETVANDGARVFSQVIAEDLDAVSRSTQASATSLENWTLRFRIRHPKRGIIWLSGAATPRRLSDGTIIWIGAIHDVTNDVLREIELRDAHKVAEKMRAERERQSLHDGLTGLPNRRYYDQTMAARLRDAQEGAAPRDCVLIRIDLDHFKYVNDTLGHEAGDLVLQRVAEVLRQGLRERDFAARIGGDEFSIILSPTQTPQNAQEVVERIQARLAVPIHYQGRQCRFGASFGIAHTEDLTREGAELQVFADAALYQAKDSGRNRMEFFTTALHQNILNDRRLGEELHEALEQDQFVPFFQPQVSASTGALVGVETLLRWKHPTRGLLGPDSFMGVAEQMRVVPEIDRIMMEKAGHALRRWRKRDIILPKISFNVSSGRMHDPDVVSMAREVAHGETKVIFELLESILVEEESEAFKFHLDLIRDSGIGIEIDDFGSGHASIISLMEIKPTALKIDKRIIAPVDQDRQSRNLVRAIVEIAETMGIGTVAEGVETRGQAEVLRDAGCDILQGYLFSVPLDEADFAEYAISHLEKSA